MRSDATPDTTPDPFPDGHATPGPIPDATLARSLASQFLEEFSKVAKTEKKMSVQNMKSLTSNVRASAVAVGRRFSCTGGAPANKPAPEASTSTACAPTIDSAYLQIETMDSSTALTKDEGDKAAGRWGLVHKAHKALNAMRSPPVVQAAKFAKQLSAADLSTALPRYITPGDESSTDDNLQSVLTKWQARVRQRADEAWVRRG